MSVDELRTNLQTLTSRREEDIHTHQEDLRIRMQQMEERLAAFDELAKSMMSGVIEPRFTVLAEQFKDMSRQATESGHGVYAQFNTERRIAAFVKFELSLHLDVDSGTGHVLYLLEILPVLMEYQRTAQVAFDLKAPDMEAVEAFVEHQLVEFMETYVRLESHPAYQLHNLLKDPVCGMLLSPSHASASATIGTIKKRTFYFCVDACRDRFLADPDQYVTPEESLTRRGGAFEAQLSKEAAANPDQSIPPEKPLE